MPEEHRLANDWRGRGKTPSREVANGSFLDSLKMEQSMTRIIDSFTCGLEITICTGRERGRGEPPEKKSLTQLLFPFNKFASEYIGLGFDGYFVFCRVLTLV